MAAKWASLGDDSPPAEFASAWMHDNYSKDAPVSHLVSWAKPSQSSGAASSSKAAGWVALGPD